MSGVDRRQNRLVMAHLDMLSSAMKLAHIDVPPDDEELRQRIAVALEAVHEVENGLLAAITREYPETRRARRLAKGKGKDGMGPGLRARRWWWQRRNRARNERILGLTRHPASRSTSTWTFGRSRRRQSKAVGYDADGRC